MGGGEGAEKKEGAGATKQLSRLWPTLAERGREGPNRPTDRPTEGGREGERRARAQAGAPVRRGCGLRGQTGGRAAIGARAGLRQCGAFRVTGRGSRKSM